ncbi:MAG: tRNA (adenosine(37)-N6)-dimethylallyltransferase MiaA [Bacteroidales bacterium]|nr:tRNA (adenosine(37)-N6)-dimethylallyltransferase MiaA [Bacteroidales bacterium]
MKKIVDKTKNCLLVITGPTGVGKTNLSIELAKNFQTEIISCDSRQFYREMKIGTAVPSSEQLAEVKHHFVQHLSITDYYNASMFEFDCLALLENLFKKNKIVIMTGGSGMYIDAVCNGIDDIPDIDMKLRAKLIERIENEGLEAMRFELKRLDPVAYNFIDLKNKQRLLRALEVTLHTGKPYSSFRTEKKKERDFEIIKVVINRKRDELYSGINRRVDQMMKDGLLEEVKSVLNFKGANALKTVGYKELFDYLENKTSIEEAVELIKRNSRRYAKRQLSWFGRDNDYKYFQPQNSNEIMDLVNF